MSELIYGTNCIGKTPKVPYFNPIPITDPVAIRHLNTVTIKSWQDFKKWVKQSKSNSNHTLIADYNDIIKYVIKLERTKLI